MKVLVVEDEEMILDGLVYSLEQEGYEVMKASTQTCALELVRTNFDVDFCLLDIGLPDGNGINICKAIREKSQVPIIFLTAYDDEVNAVRALESGADDYVTKPFRLRELMARIKAILRRSGTVVDNNLVMIGENKLNTSAGKMYRNGEEILLTAMEYKLLLVFVANRGRILSREQILDKIWDEAGNFVNDNTLTVYIKRLRAKLGETEDVKYIKTIRGLGYQLD